MNFWAQATVDLFQTIAILCVCNAIRLQGKAISYRPKYTEDEYAYWLAELNKLTRPQTSEKIRKQEKESR